MMNNNKILTVSYGTFSCTLEGFEDSFGTMKAIAEYFRDLAADDRFFGAEPPQPDAEMLARIAQKEVSRKVQAREHEGKIVLSALEDHREEAPAPAEIAATAPVVAEAEAPEEVKVTEAQALAEEEQSTAPEVETPVETAQEETPVAPLVDGQTEAEVAPVAEVPEVDIDLSSLIAPTVDAPAGTLSVSLSETAADPVVAEMPTPAEEVTLDSPDVVPGQPDAEVEAFFAAQETEEATPAEAPVLEAPEAEIAPEAAPNRAVGGQSIAEKLQRIRAVVAKTQEEADDFDQDAFLEDEHANADQPPAASTSALMRETLDDIEEALEADDEAETARQQGADDISDAHAAPASEEDDDDDVEAILARLDQGAEEPKEASVAPSNELEEIAEEPDLSALLALEETETPEAEAKEAVETAAAEAAELGTEEASPETSPAALAAADPIRPRARVVKVKRADLEKAIARGDLEEYDDEDEEASAEVPRLDDLAPSKTDESSLSAEDEQDLARELAALEADIEAELDDEDDDAEEAAEIARSASEKPSLRHRLPDLDKNAESDMDRLLAEADHKMDEPESATRRNAFTHLRAAVAAKKADVAMGRPEKDQTSDDAYRSDLAEVVRPRRPEGTAQRTPRPDERRPAPLKLVAEQRIDEGRPAAAGPVRPRRVAALAEEPADIAEDGSFADYAQDLGATTLPQLLEAAASYMSFVEGRDQFSRPQLMTKVRQAGQEAEFSREDGLRSFGQLLRSGKIEKIKGGRFTVSEDIGFRPDQRAAG